MMLPAPRRDRPHDAEIRGRDRPRARLLGALNARDLYHDALENGAQLEDVQKATGYRDRSTTKLYDRHGYNPEKLASFFAIY